ncbi:hypothetical protein [uncultured Corynebacterium sp.]|uniref:hypothetical protein n=1 Tax=uncultured Corynebacterium sp. TaxID=159447 RepID=UPI0025D461DE|nr:hypothetical protein [uncultured Corynebacterium sp.]
MTNPFSNGDAGSGPSWGQNSGGPTGRHSGNQGAPTGGSPFGSSPFGAPSTGAPGGTGGTRPVDFSSGSSPANGAVTFGTPAGPGGTASTALPMEDAPTAPVTPVTGPWAFIGAATATAVIGILLGIAAPFTGSATDSLFHTLAIVGWVLAGILTFILLGLHTAKDTKRQAESFYVGTPAQKTLYRVSAGLACVGVIVTAVEIALWISKTVGA